MSFVDEYNKIPCDLFGSMSKNSFWLEVLWSASKMFDLLYKDYLGSEL